MSYRIQTIGADAPPPDATGQALAILAACAIPCLPVAAGVAGGFIVGKNKGAIPPIIGGLLGTVVSVLYLRSSVLAGESRVIPRTA